MIVNDVSLLNPVPVWAIVTPRSTAEVQDVFRRTNGPVSIGGGHFSMGGQTTSPGSLHLDMRQMNRVLEFRPQEKTLRVEAGIRWCDIQQFIDPHDLSIRTMQTYANFTVGGSLSVNVHGRYIGAGPLISSVRAIRMVLPNGNLVDASPTQNSHLFYGAIGGYGALGVIVEAEFDLADNVRVVRHAVKMPLSDYREWFKRHTRDSPSAIFHNADLYVPHCNTVRAVTWSETKHSVSAPYRLQRHRRLYPMENYFLWMVSEAPLGKQSREWLIDPYIYLSKPVHWRNYEAGYDAAELEPPTRRHRTYVLQEYFVSAERLLEFVPLMAEIFRRHGVNVLNISIRHATADPGSLLAWARGETYALVVYYKQRTRVNARRRVAVWTRELIDAVLTCGGTYYLPYQPHATPAQFHQAYPRAVELFQLKREIDPDYRLRNALWDKYYAPTLTPAGEPVAVQGDFHRVYGNVVYQDKFYRFLQNVFHLYPEDRFHSLIMDACERHQSDEAIYRCIQEGLPKIKPALSELTYALPALARQKQEMVRQTLELLDGRHTINGYVEIGTTGRYLSKLQNAIKLTGDIVLVNEVAPTFSPVDIIERGGLRQLGRFVPLSDYDPIPTDAIANDSVELVSCYIGLHHITPAKFRPFAESICRILKPGGIFILRDHDVRDEQMFAFVALAHTVFNAGLGETWESNLAEKRHFAPIDDWVQRLAEVGLKDTGHRLLQKHDPSDNVLMAFVKGGQA